MYVGQDDSILARPDDIGSNRSHEAKDQAKRIFEAFKIMGNDSVAEKYLEED